MSFLKKIQNWLIKHFTKPPRYAGVKSLKGLSLNSSMLFLYGFINEDGERRLNTILKEYASVNKTTDVFDCGVVRDRFFINIDIYNYDPDYGVRYPVFKFFTDKLSNCESVITSAKEYLASCEVPYGANKAYYPFIIDEEGADPTFFVSTMRDELYTPPATKPWSFS